MNLESLITWLNYPFSPMEQCQMCITYFYKLETLVWDHNYPVQKYASCTSLHINKIILSTYTICCFLYKRYVWKCCHHLAESLFHMLIIVECAILCIMICIIMPYLTFLFNILYDNVHVTVYNLSCTVI